MLALQQHMWPGNVRELENVIERALIHSSGDTLQLDDTFTRVARPPAAAATAAVETTGDSLDAIQRTHIEAILQQSRWRISGANAAAERLGLHPNTLRFRLKKLGIVLPNRRDRRHGHVNGATTNHAASARIGSLTEIGHGNDRRL